jgi:hypothetical protein
VGITPP